MDLVTGMLNAYEKGKDTAILVDENNNITEGPGFNLFCVDDNSIFTPDYGVLEGITRQTVFDLAKELNISISKKPISIEQLKNAKELFATSTAGGIMPITKVNGKLIADGKVGSKTRKFHKIYWEKHKDPSWSVSITDIL
jgi:branched-chain amino acid aminotransferase